MRADARRYCRRLALPVTAVLLAFGLWTQLAYGTHWTWLVLGFAVVCQLSVVMLVFSDGGDGLAFSCTAAVVIAVVVLFFGSLYPGPHPVLAGSRLEPDHRERVILALHAQDHDLGRGPGHPAGAGVPGLDLLGVPATHLGRTDT